MSAMRGTGLAAMAAAMLLATPVLANDDTLDVAGLAPESDAAMEDLRGEGINPFIGVFARLVARVLVTDKAPIVKNVPIEKVVGVTGTTVTTTTPTSVINQTINTSHTESVTQGGSVSN